MDSNYNMIYNQKTVFSNKKFEINMMEKISRPEFCGAYHEEFEIKYFYEGETRIWIDKELVVAKQGSIVIINPFEIHYTLDSSKKGKYQLFMLGKELFENLNAFDLDLCRYIFSGNIRFNHLISNNKRLQEILECIISEMTEKKRYYQTMVSGLLVEFFSILMREELFEDGGTSMSQGSVRYYKIIEPALTKIKNEYDKKITVEELAHICAVSKHHFCRIFKMVTNETVMQYITNYRMAVADYQLKRNLNSNIAEIAKNCGYDDENYFSRCYKKRYGISPSERKSRKKTES